MAARSNLSSNQFASPLARLMTENLSGENSNKVSTFDGQNLSLTDFWQRILDFERELAASCRLGSRVAIIGKRSLSLLVVAGACILSGRTFTVVDPLSPERRRADILDNFSPALVVETDGPVPCISNSITQQNIRVDQLCEGAVYVVFTSGSTGNPKGVVIGPESYVEFVNWITSEMSLKSSDCISLINPPHFDNFIADLSLLLFTPARGFVFSDPLPEVAAFAREISSSKITHWFSVPSMLRYLMTLKIINPSAFSELRWCAFGGEPFLTAEVAKLSKFLPKECRLVNVYGPSETTCISSFYSIQESDLESDYPYPPLGTMNRNFESWLIDSQDGVGELVLQGSQVGRGYLGEVEGGFLLTSDKISSKRQYKTGDLMFQDVSGKLFFVGRADRQVKIMGHRIEPGEVESVALRDPRVNEIYVTLFSFFGGPSLGCAFSGNLSEEELASILGKKLPSYLVPRKFMKFDILPKNRNGKIDSLSIVKMLEG